MYSANGGVQVYMRRLAEVLSLYGQGGGCELDCVSLADSDCVHERHTQPVRYSRFMGARRSKALFGRRALTLAAARRPPVAVVGHLGLAPVALMLKVLGLIRSYIVVLHGTEAWKRLGWLDRIASRRATWIVATTMFTADQFCSYNGIPLRQARIIPLAVPPPARDCARMDSATGKHDLRVLTVSRLLHVARYKGIHTLIEAVAKARAVHAGVTLTIAGDGDDLPALRELAYARGVAKYVDFRGAVGDDALSALYRECDVFAMPSKGEGFGIVFLEAMSYGKPCIGGNHGGTPEVIDDGHDGFLVQHGDLDQLTERLMELWANPELRTALGERARRKVLNRYMFSRMRANWIELLDETITLSSRRHIPGNTRAAQPHDSLGI